MSYPEGCYVYVYLDGCDPIYVGAGRGNRAWVHLQPCVQRRYPYPLYSHLQKMLGAGDRPIILILKEGLTAEEGRNSERVLIELLGTQRAGTGTLLNITNLLRGDCGATSEAIMCWGKEFETLTAVSRDSRCVVSCATLHRRIGSGVDIGEAATTPATAKGWGVELTCWGETYRGWEALSCDPRCIVSDTTLRRRVTKGGWTVEGAATTPGAICGSWRRGVVPTDGNPN